MKIRSTFVYGVIGLSAILAGVLAYGRFRGPSAVAEPITITRSAILPYRDLDTRVAQDDLIVVGHVLGVDSPRWNTPDGKLPEALRSPDIPVDLVIFNDARFQVSRFLKGNEREAVLRLRSFGGTVDNVTMIYEHQEQLRPGGEYLLFLREDSGSKAADLEPGHYLLGFAPEIYTIDQGTATSPEDEWSLDDLIQYIETALAQGDTGVVDYLRQRLQQLGVPVISIEQTGHYVQVVYATERQLGEQPSAAEYRWKFIIIREFELARQEGYRIGSWGLAAEDASGNRFGMANGQTKPDDQLRLDDYAATLSDAETAELIGQRLDPRGLTVSKLEVSSSEGLQSLTLVMTAPTLDAASRTIVLFLNSVRPVLDEVNAMGAHVITFSITLTDGSGALLLDYMYDLRVDQFYRWTSDGMPRDWRPPTATP